MVWVVGADGSIPSLVSSLSFFFPPVRSIVDVACVAFPCHSHVSILPLHRCRCRSNGDNQPVELIEGQRTRGRDSEYLVEEEKERVPERGREGESSTVTERRESLSQAEKERG